MALLSIVMLGVIAGMTTSARVLGTNGQAAAVRAALTTTTDRIATMGYPGCVATPQLMTDRVRSEITVPDGYTADVTAIRYLVPTGATACTAATTAQLLTVRVTRTGSAFSVTGDVVLRDVAARPAP